VTVDIAPKNVLGDDSQVIPALTHSGREARREELTIPRSAIRPLAGAVEELLAIADRHYRAADRGIPALPWRAALAVRAARRIYSAIGARIADAGYDVTAGRAVVGKPAKVGMALAATGRTLLSLPGRAFAKRPRIPTTTLEARDVPLA
jgi:hypothetical protein